MRVDPAESHVSDARSAVLSGFLFPQQEHRVEPDRPVRWEIARWLASIQADATILCALDSIAWTFNIHGQDVPHTLVARAYALVKIDEDAELLVYCEKVTDEVVAHLGAAVRLHPSDAFEPHLAELRGKKIAVDPNRTVIAILDALDRASATIVERRDPTVLPKAIKNAAEMAGHRAAQLRDGVALRKFLHWPHSRLQRDAQDPGRTYWATEFDAAGNPTKKVDFAWIVATPIAPKRFSRATSTSHFATACPP